MRSPLISDLQNFIHQGDQLFAAADTATPEGLAQQTQQLDALTAQFKQVTSTLLPLSKVGVLLGIYETTLKNWRESIRSEERDDLRQLFLRLGVLAIMIMLVFGLGEVWRRASFRYVHDSRRRYQFLLMRRIVIWAAVVIIVILAFATELGSVFTFAGLITAGIAVAMQNVITSIVGYFFLIGKYGLRVGDRVTISGVTGEVVEIGLVRIHVMELAGPNDAQPSGRIVAFSNSIVFQPTAGIFKQIPGTNFVWHELKLTLASETDYHAAKDRITKAVDAGSGSLPRQHRYPTTSGGTEFDQRLGGRITGQSAIALYGYRELKLRCAIRLNLKKRRMLTISLCASCWPQSIRNPNSN